jgi:hypothetical protein
VARTAAGCRFHYSVEQPHLRSVRTADNASQSAWPSKKIDMPDSKTITIKVLISSATAGRMP